MEVAARYLEDVIAAAKAVDLEEVQKVVRHLAAAFFEQRRVLIIGNGGSAAAASHFAQDLSKGAIPDLEGPRLFALSLADNVPFITAIANDIGYDRIFELQLRQFARRGDTLVTISGSGNSPNILRAAAWALEQGLHLVAVTGFDGGKLLPLAHLRLHVPIMDMCKTEAVHAIVLHMIADLLRAELLAAKHGPPPERHLGT